MRHPPDVRPPPCLRCGTVDMARGPRHLCNPTNVQMMRIGQTNIEEIGLAIRDALLALRGEL